MEETIINASAEKIVYYSEDETPHHYIRTRHKQIGNTIYTIISRERADAKDTAFDITKRLIASRAESIIKNQPITTESLGGCNSGGNKQ